jgi:molecular chaperone GrpE
MESKDPNQPDTKETESQNSPDEGNGATSNASAPAAEAAPNPAELLERRLMYVQAEFENTKKRLQREQETSIRFANERLIRELLPIVSLFDRALAAAAPLKSAEEKKPEIQNFVLGIEMTHRELALTLERFGVEWVGKKGEKFNPERHEAISQVESPSADPDTVVEVLERGCLLQGRLLQPAKVVVAKSTQGS